jgi:hypothetical protein
MPSPHVIGLPTGRLEPNHIATATRTTVTTSDVTNATTWRNLPREIAHNPIGAAPELDVSVVM